MFRQEKQEVFLYPIGERKRFAKSLEAWAYRPHGARTGEKTLFDDKITKTDGQDARVPYFKLCTCHETSCLLPDKENVFGYNPFVCPLNTLTE